MFLYISYLWLGLLYLRLVFVAGGRSAWSSLLVVEIGLSLFDYGGNSAWSSLLTVPPVRKVNFVFFNLQFPHRK